MKPFGLGNLPKFVFTFCLKIIGISFAILGNCVAQAQSDLPIADAHVHYSHDSVEQTPPARVIELMRSANLKFALVSSSDDNGTQLLSELAPDLIVPGLRPYRRRGELRTWFTDPDALKYVETLLAKNTYATIGEFHLYGGDVELEIPRRIVELADKYNLILHAHSDADAIERLLAQSKTVKVIWAHSGFDSPEDIGAMLAKHDRLWADLAFRSEVGSGGVLTDEWTRLFEAHPNRLMLGTDTYTPERIYYIPETAASSRVWLNTLESSLAENIAWKNAFDLIMPVWQANQSAKNSMNTNSMNTNNVDPCSMENNSDALMLKGERYFALLEMDADLEVSEAASATATLCRVMELDGDIESVKDFKLDASMPAHGHGTNYTPTITQLNSSSKFAQYRIEGLVLHMPGKWQWEMVVTDSEGRETLTAEFNLD